MRWFLLFVLISLLSSVSISPAALIDRGGGLIYDTGLNITWLRDANYAKTSGYDSDGLMTWDRAMTWADSLEYGGYSDWRLPAVRPINGAEFNYSSRNDGATDRGYNISAPGTVYAGSHNSEMPHMYYNTLGNVGFRSIDGLYQSSHGLQNTEPFTNLTNYYYWSETAYTPTATNFGPNQGDAWAFYFLRGRQDYEWNSLEAYAWAVRDGDVAVVPEPTTFLLTAAGSILLLGCYGIHRRRHNN